MKTLDSMLLREIGTLSRSVHSICNNKFKELKLQAGQFIYITRICENAGMNLIDLSTLLRMDKTSTTKAVQKIEAEGLIQRVRDTEDKRVLRLYPTEKGLKAYEEIIDMENKNIRACLKGFRNEEKKAVMAFILRMNQNVEADWNELKGVGGVLGNDSNS